MEKILKQLEPLSPDAKLKVGAKSSYFYIGTAGDFTERIGEYSLAARSRAEQLADKAHAKLVRILSNRVTPSDYAGSVVNGKKEGVKGDLSVQGYLDWVESYFASIKAQIAACENADSALKRFVPLDQREVVSMTKSDTDENCWNMVITGYEQGGYWMSKEADARNSRLSFGESLDSEGGSADV